MTASSVTWQTLPAYADTQTAQADEHDRDRSEAMIHLMARRLTGEATRTGAEPDPGPSTNHRTKRSGRCHIPEVTTKTTARKTARQTPLKVDPETDQLISQGAHFLGLTKKGLVAEAVRVYLEQRREDLRAGMAEALQVLDGSLESDVMSLTGLTAEEIDAVGGVDE